MSVWGYTEDIEAEGKKGKHDELLRLYGMNYPLLEANSSNSAVCVQKITIIICLMT